MTISTGQPQLPQSAALIPVSPTSTPLNQRFCQTWPGDGVVHHPAPRAGHRMHADEERRVDSALEELRVLGPLVLDDEVAGLVEQLGDAAS